MQTDIIDSFEHNFYGITWLWKRISYLLFSNENDERYDPITTNVRGRNVPVVLDGRNERICDECYNKISVEQRRNECRK